MNVVVVVFVVIMLTTLGFADSVDTLDLRKLVRNFFLYTFYTHHLSLCHTLYTYLSSDSHIQSLNHSHLRNARTIETSLS